MKLRTITPEIAKENKIHYPLISFNTISRINFNEPAVKILKLKEGDKVLFHQDSESPSDWYLSAIPKSDFQTSGFVLKKVSVKNHKVLMTTSKFVTNEIRKSLSVPEDKKSFKIGIGEILSEGLITLITHLAK